MWGPGLGRGVGEGAGEDAVLDISGFNCLPEHNRVETRTF